jgi:hypothetical protein
MRKSDNQIKRMLTQLRECHEEIASESEKQELQVEIQVLLSQTSSSVQKGRLQIYAKRAERWLNGDAPDYILFN